MEKLGSLSHSKEATAVKQLWQVTRFIKATRDLPSADFSEVYGDAIRSSFPGSLESGAVPVLICARNEIDNIGKTLYGLSQSSIPVQPIVVNNASTDGTEDFSSDMGAIVVSEEQPGLMNALRRGFTYFRDTNYQGPILHTDADTIPLPNWASSMVTHARDATPDGGQTFARILYYDHDGPAHAIANGIHSSGANILDTIAHKKESSRAHGPNGIIVTDPQGNILDTLSQIQNLPNIKFHTDQIVCDAIAESGGTISFNNDLQAMVVLSGRRYPRIRNMLKLIMTRETARKNAYKGWG